MSNSLDLLDKYGLRQGARPQPASPPTGEAEADEVDHAAFGYLRGARDRALMLEFRLRNGNRRAFPYSWLGPADYNPSVGITLRFVGDQVYRVLIFGRNLNRIFESGLNLFDRGIQRHRIHWIREMDPEESKQAAEDALAIDRIDILEVRQDGELRASTP